LTTPPWFPRLLGVRSDPDDRPLLQCVLPTTRIAIADEATPARARCPDLPAVSPLIDTHANARRRPPQIRSRTGSIAERQMEIGRGVRSSASLRRADGSRGGPERLASDRVCPCARCADGRRQWTAVTRPPLSAVVPRSTAADIFPTQTRSPQVDIGRGLARAFFARATQRTTKTHPRAAARIC
jgi:hypothetical protein